ncbi:TPA: hypothetical protein EYP38_01325 [Candidatus Micrarchaeota archaeon]|nr:hypothetical protein [Candidatus Micrarchaeota archaeon]
MDRIKFRKEWMIGAMGDRMTNGILAWVDKIIAMVTIQEAITFLKRRNTAARMGDPLPDWSKKNSTS